jgi:hypothetical protein
LENCQVLIQDLTRSLKEKENDCDHLTKQNQKLKLQVASLEELLDQRKEFMENMRH